MGPILAHGAIFVSFLAVSVLWPEPRLLGASAGRPIRVVHLIVDTPAIRWALRLAVLAGTVLVVVAAAAGPDDPHQNPAASYVYGVFWVGLAVASLLAVG